MNRDFVTALLQLNAEKQVPRDQLIHTVEDAIQSAYRRQPGDEDVCVRIDGDTGRIRVFRAKVAVGEIVDPLTEFSLDEAKAFDPGAVLGDLVEIEEMDPNSFGRIHAQTAKQVVLQRLREAERDVAFDQFASREGELITGRSTGSSRGRSSSRWSARVACREPRRSWPRPSSRRLSTIGSARTSRPSCSRSGAACAGRSCS